MGEWFFSGSGEMVVVVEGTLEWGEGSRDGWFRQRNRRVMRDSVVSICRGKIPTQGEAKSVLYSTSYTIVPLPLKIKYTKAITQEKPSHGQ